MSRAVIRINPTWIVTGGLDPDEQGRQVRRAPS
jgi:hypothetical protein